jgi:hypothetical protein
MKKRVLLAALLAASLSTVAFAKTTKKFKLHQLPINYQFSFDNMKAPGHHKQMGLVGINFLPEWTSNFSAGVAGYGTISGSQGGFFALGITTQFQTSPWHHILLNANLFAGGGGGHSSEVGNGSMLRASAGVMYQFQYFNLGLHYSYITFPDGKKLRSSQIGFDISIPSHLLFSNPFNIGKTVSSTSQLNWFSHQDQLLFSHNYVAALGQLYFQESGTKNISGVKQDGTMKLIGVEAGHFFTPHWYALVKAAGAFAGGPNGYMDAMGGTGYRFDLTQFISLTAQLNLGMAGGGRVDTGGGFVMEPNVGVIYRFTPHWGAWVSGGYLDAPEGHLRAMTLTLKALYLFDTAKLGKQKTSAAFQTAQFNDWRVRVGNQTIFDAKRENSKTRDSVNLVNINIDRLINHYVYITGEGESAYNGKNVGGLAIGMFGLGLQTSMKRPWQFYVELMGGAAGGGGLAFGDGAIIQPKIGVAYFTNPYFGAQASIGQMFSLDHDLNSTTLDLSLVFRLASLER